MCLVLTGMVPGIPPCSLGQGKPIETDSFLASKLHRLASSLKIRIPELLRREVAILQHLEEELSSLEELQVCP